MTPATLDDILTGLGMLNVSIERATLALCIIAGWTISRHTWAMCGFRAVAGPILAMLCMVMPLVAQNTQQITYTKSFSGQYYQGSDSVIQLFNQSNGQYQTIIYTTAGYLPQDTESQWNLQGSTSINVYDGTWTLASYYGHITVRAWLVNYDSSVPTWDVSSEYLEFSYDNCSEQITMLPAGSDHSTETQFTFAWDQVEPNFSVYYTMQQLGGSDLDPHNDGILLAPNTSFTFPSAGQWLVKYYSVGNYFGQHESFQGQRYITISDLPPGIEITPGPVEYQGATAVIVQAGDVIHLHATNGASIQWKTGSGEWETGANNVDVSAGSGGSFLLRYRLVGYEDTTTGYVYVNVIAPSALPPVFSPTLEDGTLPRNPVTVAITSPQDDVEIWYRYDAGWTLYTGPFNVNTRNINATVEAYAKKTINMVVYQSPIVQITYPMVEDAYPTLEPAPGSYYNFTGKITIRNAGRLSDRNWPVYISMTPEVEPDINDDRMLMLGTEINILPGEYIKAVYKRPVTNTSHSNTPSEGYYINQIGTWVDQTPSSFENPIKNGPYYSGVKFLGSSGEAISGVRITVMHLNQTDNVQDARIASQMEAYEHDGWYYPFNLYDTSIMSDLSAIYAAQGVSTAQGIPPVTYFYANPPTKNQTVIYSASIPATSTSPSQFLGSYSPTQWFGMSTQQPGGGNCYNPGGTMAAAKCPDSDGDGISDVAESYFGGEIPSGTADLDQDNVPDAWEVIYILCHMTEPCQCTTSDFNTAWQASHAGQTLTQVIAATSQPRSYYDADGNNQLDPEIKSCSQGNPTTQHCCNCCCDECEAAKYGWTAPTVTIPVRPAIGGHVRPPRPGIQEPSANRTYQNPYTMTFTNQPLTLLFANSVTIPVASAPVVSFSKQVYFADVNGTFGYTLGYIIDVIRLAIRGVTAWFIGIWVVLSGYRRIKETLS